MGSRMKTYLYGVVRRAAGRGLIEFSALRREFMSNVTCRLGNNSVRSRKCRAKTNQLFGVRDP